MTLAVMALFGATLTLPGIAAIVLSIGMEVDGNILIYERIRDELNLGKSVRGAIDLGFSRAFSAILDGQLTTASAGWVLLSYGSGPIKGFAVMLLVGVFTTLTTNVWVTRIFFDWTVARKKGQLVTIDVRANAFLRGMVRRMVAVLLEVGHGRMTETEVREAIASRTPARNGVSAPARGLCLRRVALGRGLGPETTDGDD